jgi:two-component system response regulator RegX3
MTQTKRARILVVEDYPSLQYLYRAALEKEGYEVTVAQNGEEALTNVHEHEPDLILLDLLMPIEGGLEFLRAFDAKKHPSVKIVVFSNMASNELYDEAKELGALQYLTKANYTPKEVVGVIHAALQAK